MEAFLMEKANAKVIIGPVDLNTAAVTGARFPVNGYNRISFLIAVAAGTTILSRTFTLRQHNAASSGTSKDLSGTNPYYHKVNAAAVFTKVEPTVAAAAYDFLTLVGDNKALIVLEVLAEDLDVNGDFNYVSVDSADSGAASLGMVLAVGHADSKPAYGQSDI